MYWSVQNEFWTDYSRIYIGEDLTVIRMVYNSQYFTDKTLCFIEFERADCDCEREDEFWATPMFECTL